MSNLQSKRILAVAATAVAVVGGGGAAIAASNGSSPSPKTFLDAVAKHLGISSEKLQNATEAAALDQVDAALKEGDITKQQADALRSRIKSGELPPFFGRGFGGFHHGMRPFGEPLSAAAGYLGLSVGQLREKLRDGQSLADVAKARDKSVEGLKQAIVDDAEKQLDKAVSDKKLTEGQAKAILDRLRSHTDDIVNGTFERRRDRGRFFGGPPPGRFPGDEAHRGPGFP